jgi:hypothetical protein
VDWICGFVNTSQLPVLISPDGVSRFRVVKQLVTSGLAVIRPQPRIIAASYPVVLAERIGALSFFEGGRRDLRSCISEPNQ